MTRVKVQNDIIFCVWMGANPMSTNRLHALLSIFFNVGCPVAFLDQRTLPDWIKNGASFHPAFQYLSETHKADYVRTYLMHYYGGGYTDIKHTTKNWKSFFQEFHNSDKLCAGYTEIGPNGVAPVGGDLEEKLKENYKSLIGLCSFIFRSRTPITREWIDKMHHCLDMKHDQLKEHPSSHPQDRQGVTLPNGDISSYPLRWTELLGDIFHPLIYSNQEAVLHLDIAPSFVNYR